VGLRNLPSWKDYSQILLDRFDEVCEDPMAELMRLRQKGPVTKFHEQFDAIVSKVELAEEHQLSCFLGGLKQDVQMMVRMFQPDSIRKAFSLAKMYESAITTHPQQKLFSKSAKTIHFSKPPLFPTPPNPAETSNPKHKLQ